MDPSYLCESGLFSKKWRSLSVVLHANVPWCLKALVAIIVRFEIPSRVMIYVKSF